jgi:hypothetical protein
MTEKYIYFGKNTARSLALTASETNVQTFTLTTGLIDPIPDGIAGTNDLFANGAVTAEMQNLHLDESADIHVLGSAYSGVDDGTLTIHPSALSYDGVSLVTVQTVAQNATYGITMSSTVGENDVTFTANLPMLAGDAAVWPATAFLGISQVDATNCDLFFEPQTNDGVGGGVDTIRLTYSAGGFKKLSRLMHDVCADSRNQGQMIVIADTMRGIYWDNNPAGITTVAITLD